MGKPRGSLRFFKVKCREPEFWFHSNVYGVELPEQFISFEEQVHLDHTSFIDGYIPVTKVLIEQRAGERSEQAYPPV